jgi:hypothetical protein
MMVLAAQQVVLVKTAMNHRKRNWMQSVLQNQWPQRIHHLGCPSGGTTR